MDRISGEIVLVGDVTGGDIRTQVDEHGRERFVGSYREASVLDALQIGNTTLTKARCPGNVAAALGKGMNVTVYVFRTLFRVPMILGVLDRDSGEKTMIGHAYYRGTLLQFIVIHALLNAIGCFIVGAILGALVGLAQSAVPSLLGGLIGVGATWWMAFNFRKDYHAAKAATD